MAEGGKLHGVKEEHPREREEYQVDKQDEEERAFTDRVRALERKKLLLEMVRREDELKEEMAHLEGRASRP